MWQMCKARVAGKDMSDNRNWMHMHHFCDGLRFYSRAMSSTHNREDFKYYIQESLGGYDYVLRTTTPDFVMRPEINAEKARTLALAGRKAEAVMLYTSVMQQTPNFVPAYLYLADYYASSNRSKALELVSEGLRHNPETKSLQRRYRELGGKLPYPEPLAKAEPVKPPIEDAVVTETKAEPSPEQAKAANAEAGPKVEEPKIGSPKNPYCRFCPD
jgi:tetratricopeptide (TPR) repeat protein